MLLRQAVLGLPDPGALDRAFPPRPQRLHPAVVSTFGGGQVQVPAGIGRQPHPVPHARLLKGVPVRQVTGQPVDVADDHHVHRAGLDRRDQLPEPVPGDFLEPREAVILEGGRDNPAAPPRVAGGPLDLRGDRLGRVVGLAQTGVDACSELGFRLVCLGVVHESSMTQKHSGRMRRLAAAGMLPERAGQPVKAWVHIPLAVLIEMDGSTTLVKEWVTSMRATWAAHRAAASEGGGNIGAWLDGDPARAVACDAAIAPVVTGEVNPAALDDMVRLCVQLDKLRHGAPDGDDDGRGAGAEGHVPADTTRAWEAIEQAVIGKAIDLLSGSRRPRQLPAPPPARRAAGRPQPAAGHRLRRDHPGRHS